MNLKTLLAVLMLAESDMRLIHWKSATHQFDGTHSISNEYYDMIGEDIDNIAEKAMRLGLTPMGYDDAFRLLDGQTDAQFVKVDPNMNFDRKTGFVWMSSVLGMVRDTTIKVHDDPIMNEPINIGIKSDLESMIEKYDLEVRYKMVRRRMEVD